MIESLLAGFVVAFGTMSYLKVGGAVGALLYSITILSIVYYDLDLFVGKSGVLTARKTDYVELFLILLGNFIGVTVIASALFLIPGYGEPFGELSEQILTKHFGYGIDGLFVVSVFAGMVMYAGITAYEKTHIWVMLCLPIMMVVMCGWPFIVSEFFMFIGVREYWVKAYYLIPIFLGNFLGSNLFPFLRRRSKRFKNEYAVIEQEPGIGDKLRQSLNIPKSSDQNMDSPEHK